MHNTPLPTRYPSIRRDGWRRGMTSMLAMLFLVLFGTLAIGFYASTTISAQISGNDERASRATLAAESGMDFLRRHLGVIRIPTVGNPSAVLAELHDALQERLEGTGNLAVNTLGWDGTTITIPMIGLGNGASLTATIALDNPSEDADIRVVVTGAASGVSARTVGMLFVMQEQRSSILDFGVASRSVIAMDSNARITGAGDPARGSLLSTSMDDEPVQIMGNSAVSGDVSIVNPDGEVLVNTGASVAGSTNPAVYQDHIHVGVGDPEFPVVDTSVFEPYATTVLSTVNGKYDTSNLKNIRIRANTNPTFGGSIRVDGVIFIETPNRVTFDSNVIIRGVIAVQNNPTGDITTNRISFDSNVQLQGVETLPATADFPPSLRSMTGSSILAPNFFVHMDSNFGTSAGSIVAGRLWLDSNAVGTIRGSVINMEDSLVEMDSNAHITIAAPLGDGIPAGMRFSGNFLPDASSYAEGG